MSSTAAAAAVGGWLGVAPDVVLGRAGRDELETLGERLVPKKPSATTCLALRAAGTLLPLTPQALRRFATTVAKRLRERMTPETTPVVSELPFVKLARRLAGELGATLPAHGRTEISHDVDWKTCWAFVPRLAQLERENGVRSTFLFLAGDAYRIDRAVIDDLRREGFLVGIHGWTHDVGIGFRSREDIRCHLSRARDALGVEAKIYRAPGLGTSPLLLEILDELGFEVDGSLRIQGRGGSGTGTIFPYKLPGLAIEERPLAMQDDHLFRDLGLDDDTALRIVTAFLDAVVQAGGTFVWNAHPTLCEEHLAFTVKLLEHARATGAVVPFGAPP